MWFMPVITATWEAEIRRTEVSGQSRQKVSKTSISTNKLRVMFHTCNTICLGGTGSRITVQACRQKKTRLYLKNN
jgi:hypothetical protein